MFDEEKNTGSFIGGLITGGLLGVMTGLLFAPKTGKEFRKNISDKTDKIMDDTNYLIENAKQKASNIISDAGKKAEQLIDDGKKKVESMTKGAENLMTKVKDIV
jgi:gas vesicle protein